MRLIGPDPLVLRKYADLAMDVFRRDGRFKEIKHDWRNRVELFEPIVAENRARRLGPSRGDGARALRAATDGHAIGVFRAGAEQLSVRPATSPRPGRGPLASARAYRSPS